MRPSTKGSAPTCQCPPSRGRPPSNSCGDRFEKRIRVHTSPRLPIIDEQGYLTLTPVEASLLFQLVNSRYERGSISLTSTKSFAE
ncbi:putative insertion sequence ATP-binding protein [Symbiobacterium thermophilum IAM 14863]|uniref:Putative insertion sequence ATP-binding protein n=1 Tax=Symbiobacterium thermophilum (strain DSM 24528 / JCM 14929 / IAM 14863 / T) TaxID=292459 RepID=Q67KV8_SYMTH|nr:putative insertion sequence ATP-binding protein [Symbiobacterium thermophilum IAM 14863]